MTIGDDDVRSNHARLVQLRNRRLRYLERNPDVLDRLERGQSFVEADDKDERIGGAISSNLIAAYDAETRAEHRRAEQSMKSVNPDIRQAETLATGSHQEAEEEVEEFDSESGEEFEREQKLDVMDAFLRGETDFPYATIDDDSDLDDLDNAARDDDDQDDNDDDVDDIDELRANDSKTRTTLQGETGVQDY